MQQEEEYTAVRGLPMITEQTNAHNVRINRNFMWNSTAYRVPRVKEGLSLALIKNWVHTCYPVCTIKELCTPSTWDWGFAFFMYLRKATLNSKSPSPSQPPALKPLIPIPEHFSADPRRLLNGTEFQRGWGDSRKNPLFFRISDLYSCHLQWDFHYG